MQTNQNPVRSSTYRNRYKRARRWAVNNLIRKHSDDYVHLLNEARAELGMPPLRSTEKYKAGCGVRGHDTDCLCDIQL